MPQGVGVDLAFKIFQFTELVPDRLRASVMVMAPARLFEVALAGHVGDRGGVRGGDGGHRGVGGGLDERHLLYREGVVCGVGYRVFGRHVGNFEGFLGITWRRSVPRLIT